MKTWERHLASIYYAPGEAGAFAGVRKLDKAVRAKGRFVISKARIWQWLRGQEVYTAMRGVHRKFPRPKVMVSGPNQMWDIDLADMKNVEKENDGVKYILVAIDVFSKKLWAQPLPDKKPASVVKAMKVMFAEGSKPVKIRSDKGGEFVNTIFKRFLHGVGVLFSATKNETKANYAERVIRTLKMKINRYFLTKQKLLYVDVLQDMVDGYNATHHSYRYGPEQSFPEQGGLNMGRHVRLSFLEKYFRS